MALLLALVFDVAIGIAFYYFGASPATAWFTFLAFFGFTGLAEVSSQLHEVSGRLDKLTSRQWETPSPSAEALE